jgi:hypothetical protein
MTVSFLPPGLPLSIFSTRALDLRPLPALAPPLAVPSFAIKSPSFPIGVIPRLISLFLRI